MNKIKKRETAEKTTPILMLEDHELRLRYIESYIRDGGTIDYANKEYFFANKPETIDITKKKGSGPIIILEDHELRLRKIEMYINSRKEDCGIRNNNNMSESNIMPYSSSSSTTVDPKKEITIILSRIGELLTQMR